MMSRKMIAAILALALLFLSGAALSEALTRPRLTGVSGTEIMKTESPQNEPANTGEAWPRFSALLNQRMATRTGPGTKYTEDHGTLPQSTPITILQRETTNDVEWVLVEFMRNDGKKVRAYTGMKRIDIEANVSDVPEAWEEPLVATTVRGTEAYYGPGGEYLMLEEGLRAGAFVLVFGVDSGYALVEYSANAEQWTRAWVPESALAIP